MSRIAVTPIAESGFEGKWCELCSTRSAAWVVWHGDAPSSGWWVLLCTQHMKLLSRACREWEAKNDPEPKRD